LKPLHPIPEPSARVAIAKKWKAGLAARAIALDHGLTVEQVVIVLQFYGVLRASVMRREAFAIRAARRGM
jgi:hypothetical protein